MAARVCTSARPTRPSTRSCARCSSAASIASSRRTTTASCSRRSRRASGQCAPLAVIGRSPTTVATPPDSAGCVLPWGRAPGRQTPARPRDPPARAMRRRIDPDDTRDLVRACAAADTAARRTFQERYGEDIYNFPVKIYGVPTERAVDFYVYVFERDRIFTRMRTFEGRNGIQFRTFLAYYVLRSLFLEWQRGNRELDTVSLSDHHPGTDEGDSGPGNASEAPGDPREADGGNGIAAVWATLAPEEQLDLKLLSLLEYQLTSADIGLLARLSGRSVADTTAIVAEVETGLRERDVKLTRLRDDLDSVWGWIVLRQRELQETSERLRLIGSNLNSTTARRLVERRGELEHALAKRMRKREGLLEEIREFKMTTPYKDIARLLNFPVGTVCSRIFRLRQRLEQRRKPAEARP